MIAGGKNLQLRALPFRHAVFAAWLSRQSELQVLQELERIEWERESAPAHRFSVPTDLSWHDLLLSRTVDKLLTGERRSLLEQAFDCSLSPGAALELHKYVAGDGIAPHTDRQLADVRVVLNLNRGWRLEEGGVWILSDNPYLQQHVAYLPAWSNTGFAFSTDSDTFHALARYEGPEMYCLVFRMARR